jgi:hypothetical protein
MIEALDDFFAGVVGSGLVNLLVALVILIVGYIVVRIIASLVRRVLHRINLDNRLAKVFSEAGEPREFPIEDTVARIVFWALFLFVLVAFFRQLGLTGIATPLLAFLTDLTTIYLPRLLAAGALLLVAWIVATILRFLVKKGVVLLKLDQRLGEYAAVEGGEQVSFGDSVATAVYWFVFVLFLPSVLSALGIEEIAQPVQSVSDAIIGYIPSILAALLVGIIGWLVARIIRQVVTSLLKAIGVDQFGRRVGLGEERSLSDIVGTFVYIFILLIVILAALDTLNISAISEPVTRMLNQIVTAIPNLIGAALVLVVTYAIARLVADLVKELLSGIGFDTLPARLGFDWSGTTTPSEWVRYLVMVAIMLFAATTAAELLGSDFLVNALNVFIGFFWRVILAVIILAIGFYFARLAYRAVLSTGVNQANLLGRLAQAAIVVFSGAIALGQVGVASEIINLAFGIFLGAIAVAAALAFGLGGRDIAARELDRFVDNLREPDHFVDNLREPDQGESWAGENQ